MQGESINETEHSRLAENLFAAIKGRGMKIIDLGAGRGRDSIFFSKNGFKVLAVDKDSALLKRLPDRINKKITDVLDFDFCSEDFDIIYSNNMLHFLPSAEIVDILKKIRNISRRGNFVAFQLLLDDGNIDVREIIEIFDDWRFVEKTQKQIIDPGHRGNMWPHPHQILRIIAEKVG